MDKKNFAIGAVLLIGAFVSFLLVPRPAPAPKPTLPAITAPAAGSSGASGAAAPATGSATASATPPVATPAPSTNFAAVHADAATATITTLSNDFIIARFTDSGGALLDVALKKYPAVLGHPEPFVFNALHADPMLAFVDFPGLDRGTRYERVSQTAGEVVYRAVFQALNAHIEVTRRYVLAPNAGDKTDPYQLRHETTFKNLSDQGTAKMLVGLSIGTVAPTSVDDDGLQLTTGFSTGAKQAFIKRDELGASGGFFGMGARAVQSSITSTGPLTWAGVKNKFFVSILTPDEPAASLVTRRVKLLGELGDENPKAYGIAGAAQFQIDAIPPHAEKKVAGSFYVGPKEYRRLANADVFKADQDKIMQFGFFKFFSQILLTLMTWIHSFVGNWGLAIVLTTLALKTIFIPFTLAASRSAKRMQKIQPEMQAVREKYKDNPKKQQEATMALFKQHKVNPVGGCFPVLITIPFFMGFFQMLQSTADLRFAPFLWTLDLSAPDTVGHLWGLPIRIMPLLMGATMVFQMRLTPSPSVDNAQAKMMQFMPYVFTLFCYGFSCALSLYSFTNGLFTIGQQLVINKMKDPADAGPAGPGTAAASTLAGMKKGMKNVTPPKK